MTGGFSNPIIGGGGALVYPAIKSPNYVPSVSGWSINKDGSAEFDNLTIRGTFQGTDFEIDDNGIYFYSGTPAANNLLLAEVTQSGTDGHGNSTYQGLTLYSTDGGGNYFALNLNGIGGFTVYQGTDQSSFGIQYSMLAANLANTGTVWGLSMALVPIAAPPEAWNDWLYALKPGANTPESWHNLSLINGWGNIGGSNVDCRYQLCAAPAGAVALQGAIGETAKTSNVIGVLPSAYWPTTIQYFAVGTAPTGGTAKAGDTYIEIDTSGNVSVLGYAGGTTGLQVFFSGLYYLD